MALPQLTGPYTVDEYYRLGEIGILGPDDRVELVDGRIVEMTAIGPRHARCVNRLTRLFSRLAGDRADVSVQNPVVLSVRSVPQPDVAVLTPPVRGAVESVPRANETFLVIEVSDTTVAYDRDVKMPLYAQAGIPEAWLVNLPADRIEVHTKPGPDGYADVRIAQRGETLSPLLLDGVTLQVDEILG